MDEVLLRLKLSHICRLCGKEDDSLIPIFEGKGQDIELKSMIERYLPLEISDCDELPKQVCQRCVSTLWEWHDLRISCIEVNDNLVKYVREARKHFISQCKLINEGNGGEDNSGGVGDLQEAITDPLPSESRGWSLADSLAGCNEYSVEDSAFPFHELVSDIDSSNVQVTWDHNYVLRDCYADSLAPNPRPLSGLTYHLRVAQRCGKRTLVTVRWRHNTSQPAACCNVCKQTFSSEGVLVTHTRFHGNKTPFYCKHCGHSFRLLSSLCQHLCTGCPLQQESVTRATAAHPLTRNNVDRHFPCPQCPRRYKLKASLKEHLRHHLGKGRAKRRCNVCFLKFFRKADLLEHIQGHLGESREGAGPVLSLLLQCEVCDKSFLSKKDLQEHKISHSDARPFVCSTCSLTYKRKSHLTRHIALIHTGRNWQQRTAAALTAGQQTAVAVPTAGQQIAVAVPTAGQQIAVAVPTAGQQIAVAVPTAGQQIAVVVPTAGQQIDAAALTAGQQIAIAVPTAGQQIAAVAPTVVLQIAAATELQQIVTETELQQIVAETELQQIVTETELQQIVAETELQQIVAETELEQIAAATELQQIAAGTELEQIAAATELQQIAAETELEQIAAATELQQIAAETELEQIAAAAATAGQQPVARPKGRPGRPLAPGQKGIDRSHVCPECGRGFRQSGAMSRHVRIVHGGARDYACNVCGNTFTAKATRDSHLLIHTGEKPFSCAQCPKKFRTAQQQRLHATTHSDARPHTCSFCGKSFRRRPHLTVHMRTHTGERPFMCTLCDRGFAQKNDMIKHLSVHARHIPATAMPASAEPTATRPTAFTSDLASDFSLALASPLAPTIDPALGPDLATTIASTLDPTLVPALTHTISPLSPTSCYVTFPTSEPVPSPLPATEANTMEQPSPTIIDVPTSGPDAFTDEPSSFVYFM